MKIEIKIDDEIPVKSAAVRYVAECFWEFSIAQAVNNPTEIQKYSNKVFEAWINPPKRMCDDPVKIWVTMWKPKDV